MFGFVDETHQVRKWTWIEQYMSPIIQWVIACSSQSYFLFKVRMNPGLTSGKIISGPGDLYKDLKFTETVMQFKST